MTGTRWSSCIRAKCLMGTMMACWWFRAGEACVVCWCVAGWSSSVARQSHKLEARGSNPRPATKSKPRCFLGCTGVFHWHTGRESNPHQRFWRPLPYRWATGMSKCRLRWRAAPWTVPTTCGSAVGYDAREHHTRRVLSPIVIGARLYAAPSRTGAHR